MAFKFIAFFASVAVVAQAATFWQGQPQQDYQVRMWQEGRSDPTFSVSRNWQWNDNLDRQIENQDRRLDQQWQRGEENQRLNDQWNRNNWQRDSQRNDQWNNQERQQWQQQENWNRNRGDESFDSHPRYDFGYEVRDPWTGDFKSHSETRDGDMVRGQYSMMEADGSRRVVDYTADNENGFNANVRKKGWSRH